jgi:hypothetical protein
MGQSTRRKYAESNTRLDGNQLPANLTIGFRLKLLTIGFRLKLKPKKNAITKACSSARLQNFASSSQEIKKFALLNHLAGAP